MPTEHQPGLPSLNQNRQARRNRAATGRADLRGGIPPNVFLWSLLILVLGGFLYYRNAMGELEDQRSSLLTKQRATVSLLGPKLIPLRDRIEASAKSLADGGDDFVDPDVDWESLLQEPGLYLRILQKNASSPEKLRKAALESLRDGFTACAIVDPSAKVPSAGNACKNSNECESGEYCNAFDACQRPRSPFNVRMLYRALSVLSEKWVKEVRELGTDTSMTLYDRSLDSVTKLDIPLAIDIYQRSKFVLIVLDEEPKGGIPDSIKGARETEIERVQRTAHTARVGVWDLKQGKLIARVAVSALGMLRDVGSRRAPAGEEALASRTRTANSCALAMEFKTKLQNKAKDSTVSAVESDSKIGEVSTEKSQANAPQANAPQADAP